MVVLAPQSRLSREKQIFFFLLFFLFDIHVRAAVISSDLNILHFHVYALHMRCVKAVSLKICLKKAQAAGSHVSGSFSFTLRSLVM